MQKTVVGKDLRTMGSRLEGGRIFREYSTKIREETGLKRVGWVFFWDLRDLLQFIIIKYYF